MLMEVETAFLYGEIKEEIFTEVPVGMREIFSDLDDEEENSTCYRLLKGIYGQCQSARQFWRSFVSEMA